MYKNFLILKRKRFIYLISLIIYNIMSIIENLFHQFQLKKEDLENLNSIDEFIIIEETESEFYIDMMNLSQEIKSLNKGNFTISINNIYLICFDKFKKEIKNIFFNFIKKIKDEISLDDLNLNDLKILSCLSKLILIFIPEFLTLYNLKIKILDKIKNNICDNSFENETYFNFLTNELKFINLINTANRKCCYSWFYRLKINNCVFEYFNNLKYQNNSNEIILINNKFNYELNLKGKITDYDILKLYDEIKKFYKKIKILEEIHDYYNIEGNKKLYVIFDILLLKNINCVEKRNYHLWKYILNFCNSLKDIKHKLCYLYFAIYCLSCDNQDYSALSFIINFFDKKLYTNKKRDKSNNEIETLDNKEKIQIYKESNDLDLNILKQIIIDYFVMLSKSNMEILLNEKILFLINFLSNH